jgi:L-iditol 2-dehydrogenase
VLKCGIVDIIPDGVGFDEATLAEPLSSVINSQQEAGTGLGETVLIFGDGPIGCMHLEIARSRGAHKIIMVGLKKLELAEVFNPDFLLDASKTDPVPSILKITDDAGADIAICANPVSSTQQQALECVKKRGKVILFGGLPSNDPYTSLNSNTIHYNEITLKGAFSSPAYMNRVALDVIKHRKITPEKYLTKNVNIDYIVEGLRAAEKGEALKVIVKPQL